MNEATSRQRVIQALSHQEPDRVPFDCHFGYQAYLKLREHLGYAADPAILPSGPDLTIKPSLEFMEEFGIDLYFVGMKGGSGQKEFTYGMDVYTDEWGISHQKIEDGYSITYQPLEHPLEKAKTENLETYPWPDPDDPVRIEGLEERCRMLSEETEFALVGRFNTPIFEQALMLRGFENILMDMVINPEFAGKLFDKLTDIAIQLIEVGLNTCGSYLQVLRLAGDDMGHQRGTILSPPMFKEFIKPRFTRLYRAARTMFHQVNPHGKLMAHTDGDVYKFIPDYLEMGLDVLNPVQPHVTNMDHQRLKDEFGDRLSFHGAIDIQRLMPFGTPEEVKAEAVRTMQVLGKNGGYILAPTHYLQADVPPENIVALRDAVMQFGRYPLS